MNSSKRFEIFSRLKAANPNPTTELVYRTPFELLVAVVLSAQATDKSVNIATKILFQKANTRRNRIRTILIDLSGLMQVAKQMELFEKDTKQDRISSAMDILRRKYNMESPQ